RDGVKSGAMGMMNTTWDDSGETFFAYHWYPLVWGAEVSWNPLPPGGPEQSDGPRRVEPPQARSDRQSRLQEFDDSFDGCFYGAAGNEITTALWRLSSLKKNPV